MIARILRALSLRRSKPVEDDPHQFPDGDRPHVPMIHGAAKLIKLSEQDPDAWWRNPFEPSDITNEQGKRR